MDDSIRKILERPFATELLKQRQGPNGMVLTYVEVQHYIDRLNEAFAGVWSWEVTRREQIDDQLIIEGKLSAGGVVKTGIGGATVARRRDGGSPISLADDLKKAEADALKRAARMYGVAAHLYGTEVEEEHAEPARPAPVRTVQPVRPTPAAPVRPIATARPSGNGQAAAPERSRLTAKQLNALWAIARGQGMGDAEFRSYCVETSGCQPEFLSKTFASQLIGSLTGNGRERAVGQEG